MDKTIKLTLILSLLFSVLVSAEEVKIPPILIQQVEQGDAQSAYLIGMMFLNGEGAIKANRQQAQKWLQKAAEMNQPHAMFELASLLYDKGQFKQAKPWLKKAAEQGHGEAYYFLSFYPSYHRQPYQCQAAYQLLEKAQNRGVEDAFNDHAWLLATLPEKDCRNGEKAWRIFSELERSFATAEDMPPPFIDTKAAVLAEIAEFNEAIELQSEVVYISCDFELEQKPLQQVEKWLKKHPKDQSFCYNAMLRLQSYLQRKPWRESLEYELDESDEKLQANSTQNTENKQQSRQNQ